jgi:cobaltochelatase CobS
MSASPFTEEVRAALHQRGYARSLAKIRLDPRAEALVVVEHGGNLRLSSRLESGPSWLASAVADAVTLPVGSQQHDRALRALGTFAPDITPLCVEESPPAAQSPPARERAAAREAPLFDYRAAGAVATASFRRRDAAADNEFLFPDEAGLIADCIEADDVVLLVGPTGCGKSTLLEKLASKQGRMLFRVNLSAGTRESDFLGHIAVKVDRESGRAVTAWTDGILLQAMTHARDDGALLLVDEVDCALPEVLVALHRVMEPSHPRRVVVPEDGGRVVEATPGFRIALTANTNGAGDEAGVYLGTGRMNAAFRDRLTILQLDYTPREVELLARHLKRAEAELLVRWASEVRAQIAAGALSTPLSTRVLVRVAAKVPAWGLPKALEVEVLNRLPSEERAAVAELAHAILGIEP